MGGGDMGNDTKTNNTTETLDGLVLAKPHRMKKQVFVSFRGEDTRDNFFSLLERELSEKEISMFVDSKLERGMDIWGQLDRGIQTSQISVIIFSADYTNSCWCMKEMRRILECNEMLRQDVIFVLYNVDLTYMNESIGKFEIGPFELETEHGGRMQLQRSDEKDAGSIVAFESMKFRDDAELLEVVVDDISNKLNGKHPINSEGYIGREKSIEHIKSLLQNPCSCSDNNVCLIGVWGMGGIGKTIIAELVYKRVPDQEFRSRAFLANVREESQRHGIISLKEKLSSTLLGDDSKNGSSLPGYVDGRLAKKKVLIVLDDVNDSKQLEKLVGDRRWFGSGSRIIVTSRDKQVLAYYTDDDHIHEVGVLDSGNSLKVFNKNAFEGDHNLEMEYDKLSKRVVNYAKGNPFVLQVYGHLLRGKDKKLWKSHLDMLKKYPIKKKIYDRMKLSYDDLQNEEQKIFLDIACFFSGLFLNEGYMEILLKDHEGDNSVASGLERLKEKSLIKVPEGNRVYMHDIIQGTGREIDREECNKNPGRCSRLWDPDDIEKEFKNNGVTKSIRSIRTDLSGDTELKLSPEVFFEMSELQFIHFYSKNAQDGLDILSQGRLEYLPTELRYLSWRYYPLKSLPDKFSPENLVILDLPYSQLEILWHGVKNLVNLKQVTLYGSKFLKELPDFSKAINLERLDIRFCPQLTELNASILNFNKLQILKSPPLT